MLPAGIGRGEGEIKERGEGKRREEGLINKFIPLLTLEEDFSFRSCTIHITSSFRQVITLSTICTGSKADEVGGWGEYPQPVPSLLFKVLTFSGHCLFTPLARSSSSCSLNFDPDRF